MAYKMTLAAACGAFALLAFAGAPQADERRADPTYARQGHVELTKSQYRRKRGARVRGYLARRGGYSYTDADVINSGSRSLNDPSVELQSPGGPFDHGFFFDSGIGPRGGNAPYPR
jgi:hypothetical protein